MLIHSSGMIPACRRSSHHVGQSLFQLKDYRFESAYIPMQWYILSCLPLKLLKDRSKYCKSVMCDHFGRGPAKHEQHSFQKALHDNLPLQRQTRMHTCACLRVQGEGVQGAYPEVMRCQTTKSQQALCGTYQRQQTVSLCQSMHVHMG